MLHAAARLASCGADGTLLLWDYVARRPTRRFQHSAPLLCLAPRADRAEVLAGSQDARILRFPMHEPVCAVHAARSWRRLWRHVLRSLGGWLDVMNALR